MLNEQIEMIFFFFFCFVSKIDTKRNFNLSQIVENYHQHIFSRNSARAEKPKYGSQLTKSFRRLKYFEV